MTTATPTVRPNHQSQHDTAQAVRAHMARLYLSLTSRVRLWRLRHNTARPDIVTADQPQPVDALLVGQVRCTWRSSVHAAPAAAWINLREWGRGVEREA